MKCNVYDFDKTIYKKDSSISFYLFCLRRNFWKVIRYLPRQVTSAMKYCLKRIDKTTFKASFFSFLQSINAETEVKQFWLKEEKNIYPWYLSQKKSDDIIITASPYFLVSPICRNLHIKYIIGTDMNIETGKIKGKNCHDLEKVNRLTRKFPEIKIDSFYSDSLSDLPLAQLADSAFLVKNGVPTDWPFQK